MRQITQDVAYNLSVFMTDSSDHVTGKTGLTLTITASKNGAAFASISPTVTERGNGWYSLALTTSHTDTVGDLALHITATGADPTDLVVQVVAAPLEPYYEGAVSDLSPAADGFDIGTSGYSSDSFNGMFLHFTSGSLKGLARQIQDHVVSLTESLDFTGAEWPSAPGVADTFIIAAYGGPV